MKTITILMMLASLSFARVGETIEECNARYGEGIKDPKSSLVYYERSEYLVVATFAGNEAICVTYVRKDQKELDNVEIATFLKANNPKTDIFKWVKSNEQTWICTGAGIQAARNKEVLIVYNREKYDPLKKSNGAKNLQGF